MDSDKAYKKNIGARLTKKLAEALRQGVVNEDETSEIATYILDNIDNAENSVQLLEFMEKLAKKWPLFQGILVLEQGEVDKQKEDVALQQASELLKSNDIEGALDIAENANSSDTGGNK